MNSAERKEYERAVCSNIRREEAAVIAAQHAEHARMRFEAAKTVMAGLVSDHAAVLAITTCASELGSTTPQFTAGLAVDMADALLAELGKEKP